jgi:hypothetical protein
LLASLTIVLARKRAVAMGEASMVMLRCAMLAKSSRNPGVSAVVTLVTGGDGS